MHPAVPTPPSPRTRSTRGTLTLAAVNVALAATLAALLAATPSRAANAQPEGARLPRARGEYTMLAGRISAGGPAAVHLLDSVNQELVTIRWDASRKNFAGIGFRSFETDIRTSAPGR